MNGAGGAGAGAGEPGGAGAAAIGATGGGGVWGRPTSEVAQVPTQCSAVRPLWAPTFAWPASSATAILTAAARPKSPRSRLVTGWSDFTTAAPFRWELYAHCSQNSQSTPRNAWAWLSLRPPRSPR